MHLAYYKGRYLGVRSLKDLTYSALRGSRKSQISFSSSWNTIPFKINRYSAKVCKDSLLWHVSLSCFQCSDMFDGNPAWHSHLSPISQAESSHVGPTWPSSRAARGWPSLRSSKASMSMTTWWLAPDLKERFPRFLREPWFRSTPTLRSTSTAATVSPTCMISHHSQNKNEKIYR